MSYRTRPILFNGDMIRAILDGLKTQTRRVIKPQPTRTVNDWSRDAEVGEVVMYRGWPHRLEASSGRNKRDAGELYPRTIKCPYGQPGDGLIVRETWAAAEAYDEMPPREIKPYGEANGDCIPHIWYAEDEDNWLRNIGSGSMQYRGRTRSARFMCLWMSRIRPEITDVRVQRVADISEEDAKAEGVQLTDIDVDFIGPFSGLWELIHGDGAWERNDFVWALTFKRVDE